jgi:hypothetical protein
MSPEKPREGREAAGVSVASTMALLAAWRAQEAVVCAEEEKDDAEGRHPSGDIFKRSPECQAAHDVWTATGDALFSHIPVNAAELSLMVDFFAKQCEDGEVEVSLNGKSPWTYLRRMVRAMADPPPPNPPGSP